MWKEAEIRLLSSKVYTPQVLSFGVPGEKDEEGRQRCKRYFTCRDFFQNQKDNANGLLEEFWFCHGENTKGEHVAAFFEEVEKRLRVKPRSKFGPTSRAGILWVQWSPFWRKYSMRRSLFTAFLRAATAYDPGNPEKSFEFAINSQYYTEQTKAAVELFLTGCTIYTGPKKFGWHDAFRYKNSESVKKILRKPVPAATP
jgi:hypothetical protein